MNEFEEFFESLIVAEKISPDHEMVILTNDDPKLKYEIRVDCHSNEEIFSYSIYVGFKPRVLVHCPTFEELPVYLTEKDLKKANDTTIEYKAYLNKKFKGTLAIDTIIMKPLVVLQISGGLIALREFLSCHKQTYIDFLNKKSPI